MALLICASVASVLSAAPQTNAAVDLSAATTPFPHFWKRCVGSGHMLLGTRQDWRTHLKLAHDELGFTGIRGHGVLDDDMSVLPSKGNYEFYNVDQVFDYLMKIGVRPVVELSFMPSVLVNSCKTAENDCHYAFGDHGGYKGLTMPPDDFDEWRALVQTLAEHLVERYGLDEVAQWHFEVWNEMWGVAFPDPYMQLFNASSVAIKAVSPKLKVGGPATMQTQFVADFIKACHDQKVAVDFVSTHYYPTDPQCQTAVTKDHPDCFADMVQTAQGYAADAKLPFFITEYNNGLGATSRDDSSAAAFVFRMVGLLKDLDMFSWWTFSDVFEEGWMRSAPFHNGYGMMTVQGTRKPVWRAFEQLMGAGTERVPVTGLVSPQDGNSTVSILATVKGKIAGAGAGAGAGVGLQLFIANYHRLGDVTKFKCDEQAKKCAVDSAGAFTDEALCDANCGSAHIQGPTARGSSASASASASASSRGAVGDCPPAVLNLTIAFPAGTTIPDTVHLERIDETHANPQGLWKSMGSPSYPNSSMLAALDKASEVTAERLPLTKLSEHTASLVLALPGYSTAYISL